jgi:diamine N-acetyltransferase
MTELSLRDADAGELPLVAELAGRIWRAYYPPLIGEAQTEYMLAQRYSPEALAAELEAPGHVLAIAHLGGEPVGFANWFAADRGRIKLDKLYLLPDLHGRGLGQALLGLVVERARSVGATALHLAVNKGNARAIRAYERAGFSRIDSVVVHIGEGFVMDDFVYELALG